MAEEIQKFVDVEFTLNEDCVFDLTIDENGDFTKLNSFWTAILLSLFCERRASPTEIQQSFRRRGWIGNINAPVEYGSKLWLLENRRLILETVNDARTYTEQCLQWFVDFGYLDVVTVTTSGNIEDILENFVENRCTGALVKRDLETGALLIDIVLSIGGDTEIRRNIQLWQNTRAMAS